MLVINKLLNDKIDLKTQVLFDSIKGIFFSFFTFALRGKSIQV